MNNETKSKVAIVQARYGSTRLRGKIFKNLSGKPMLWHVLNRISYSKLIDKVVVATTTDPLDNKTEDFCKENKIGFYRGSIDDVLTRYYEAAMQFEAEIIIRITSDCPLVDPVIVDKMLNEFINNPNSCDYLSNIVKRTFPRGLDTEIFSFDALEKAFAEAETGSEREHVTQYIYSHPNLFTIKNYANDVDYSFYRWTVDTEEDFKLIEEIYNSLYTSGELFLFDDVLRLMQKNPSLININKNVKQKPA